MDKINLFGITKLKECVFRQWLPVIYPISERTASYQTNLEESVCSSRIIDISLSLTVQVYGFYSQLQTLRDTHVFHIYVSGRRKNLFLNWFALCHCHRYVFPVLTGSCNSISRPSTSLWNRSVLGWLGLLKLADLLLLHVFRDSTCMLTSELKSQGVGEEEGEEKRHSSVTTKYKVSKQLLKINHF